jgi:hypothetical protein
MTKPSQSPESSPPPDQPQPGDNAVERAARKIVPPSTEVSDDELKDPGRMTPGAPPADNRS